MPPYTVMGGKPFIKSVQNPPKSAFKNGVYLPRLTVIKAIRNSGYVIELKIELSLPKLFFGNNFDELENNNFLRIIRLLSRALYSMEVEVAFEDLENASVSAIHYSKNIHLKNYTSCSMVLSELQKIDLSQRIDVGSEKFRNGGHALHFHTNTRDLVFYDKIKDLEQAKVSEKRAIEKDNLIQMALFDEFPNPKALQVLRMELRLGNPQEIKRTFSKVGIETDLRFNLLFKKHISQKVLKHFWEQIQESSQILNFKTEGVFEMAESLKANNPNLKAQKILEYIGFLVLGKEESTKRLRSFLGYEGSSNANRKWYAVKKAIKSLKYDRRGNYQALDEVGSSLVNYEPTKLCNFNINE
ncbi:MAG: hypothetical protein K9M51_03910 [Candidatus Gracilibacteria bacterium]|nr:hypothetical protein [Candidatus Gracilibacteria bacterium]